MPISNSQHHNDILRMKLKYKPKSFAKDFTTKIYTIYFAFHFTKKTANYSLKKIRFSFSWKGNEEKFLL